MTTIKNKIVNDIVDTVIAENHKNCASALIPHHALLLPNGVGFVGDTVEELKTKLVARFTVAEIESFLRVGA